MTPSLESWARPGAAVLLGVREALVHASPATLVRATVVQSGDRLAVALSLDGEGRQAEMLNASDLGSTWYHVHTTRTGRCVAITALRPGSPDLHRWQAWQAQSKILRLVSTPIASLDAADEVVALAADMARHIGCVSDVRNDLEQVDASDASIRR